MASSTSSASADLDVDERMDGGESEDEVEEASGVGERRLEQANPDVDDDGSTSGGPPPPRRHELLGEEVDLEAIARDYAQYLVVNSKQDEKALDERIDSVVVRVDEFKGQLKGLHQNLLSSSEKTRELHHHTQQLKDLFHRIDQVEAFLAAVSKNMDALEDSVTLAEKELDPNALQKMFKTLPLLRKSTKLNPATKWQPPTVFSVGDFFDPKQIISRSQTPPSSQASVSSTSPSPSRLPKQHL